MKRITYSKFKEDVKKLANILPKEKYKNIYGVPRGGVYVAIELGKCLNVDLVSEVDNITEDTLVVDDLVDSGKTLSKFPEIDRAVLYRRRKTLVGFYYVEDVENDWIEFWYEKTNQDIQDNIIRILEYIGENPNRQGLKDTPNRILNMYDEIFKGYKITMKPEITVFNNNNDGIKYGQMIFDTGEFYSFCEHHFLPFFGEYHFAYIPEKKLIGLSKVARIVDWYSSKLQIQERLVKEIADELEDILRPVGIALILRARHLCKEIRGIKNKGEMVTFDLRGVFREVATRQEFFDLIGRGTR